MAEKVLAWEIVGSTVKVFLDVPPEKRHGLPSKVTLPFATFKDMVKTWDDEAEEEEPSGNNPSVIARDEMD